MEQATGAKGAKLNQDPVTLTPEQDQLARNMATGVDQIEIFLELGEEDLKDKKLSIQEAIGLIINAPAVWNGVKSLLENNRAARKFAPEVRAAIRAKAAEYTNAPDNNPTRVSLVIDYATDLATVVEKVIAKSAKLLKALRAISAPAK